MGRLFCARIRYGKLCDPLILRLVSGFLFPLLFRSDHLTASAREPFINLEKLYYAAVYYDEKKERERERGEFLLQV